jgi:hypothetical protein
MYQTIDEVNMAQAKNPSAASTHAANGSFPAEFVSLMLSLEPL